MRCTLSVCVTDCCPVCGNGAGSLGTEKQEILEGFVSSINSNLARLNTLRHDKEGEMDGQTLSDIKVIDLTWYIAGPFCTKLFADFGAEVLKIERPPDGDPARKIGPFLGDDPHPEKSLLFSHLNLNKKSIIIDLKSARGRETVKELVKDADILVENFSPGVMERLGLDYEILKKINQKLVMTSISNFGQIGPYRDFKASELVFAGLGHDMYSTGITGRHPL